MGGPTQDIDVVENFLILRGILKPTELIKEKKDKETLFLCNQSSYLNKQSYNDDTVQKLNEELILNTEELQPITLEGYNVNYKRILIDIFNDIQDPFQIEFEGETNYEQNPSDPSKP